jgi:hypothetical protein
LPGNTPESLLNDPIRQQEQRLYCVMGRAADSRLYGRDLYLGDQDDVDGGEP